MNPTGRAVMLHSLSRPSSSKHAASPGCHTRSALAACLIHATPTMSNKPNQNCWGWACPCTARLLRKLYRYYLVTGIRPSLWVPRLGKHPLESTPGSPATPSFPLGCPHCNRLPYQNPRRVCRHYSGQTHTESPLRSTLRSCCGLANVCCRTLRGLCVVARLQHCREPHDARQTPGYGTLSTISHGHGAPLLIMEHIECALTLLGPD